MRKLKTAKLCGYKALLQSKASCRISGVHLLIFTFSHFHIFTFATSGIASSPALHHVS
jgi:hypothetical protein